MYADALMERGDARGEFIALQLADPKRERKARRAARERAARLLSEHKGRWLGPLSAVLQPDFVFERGFLARCTVPCARPDRLHPVEGHPLWATVHTLSGTVRIACHPVMTALRQLSVDMVRAADTEQLASPWGMLLGERPLPIRTLTYRASRRPSDRELELLSICPALPELEHLSVRDDRPMVLDALMSGPVLARIGELTLDLPGDPLGICEPIAGRPCQSLLGALYAAPVAEWTLKIRRAELSVTLHRGEEGYEEMELVVQGPTALDALGRLLDLLPRLKWVTLRSVRTDRRCEDVRWLLMERGISFVLSSS